MNILIDLRPLQSGNISGVEVFTENIVKAMIEEGKDHKFFLWTNSEDDLSSNFPQFTDGYVSKEWREIMEKDRSIKPRGMNVYTLHTRKPNKFFNLLLSILRFPKIDKFVLGEFRKHHVAVPNNKFDVVFLPDLRPAPVSSKVKKFIFLHDLSFIHFPDAFSKKSKLWHKLLRIEKELHEAKRILVPSNFTKGDVTYTVNIPEWRVKVVYEGVDSKFSPASDVEIFEVKKRYNLPEKFILSLCTLEPRKNIKSLIEAFVLFKNKYPDSDLKLVISGKKIPENFAEVELPHPKDVVFTGFIPEDDKVALLSAAYAFAFPSIFEGFGLPILEAMACGTPVIASSFTSLPEIVGEESILFDPTNTEEILASIEKIYLDQNLREKLSYEGMRRAKEFTWRRAAKTILGIIERDVI